MKLFIFYGLFALAKSSIFMNTYANNRLFHNLGHHQKAEKLDLLRDLLCASRNEKELRKIAIFTIFKTSKQKTPKRVAAERPLLLKRSQVYS